jgi:hypothetical protein
MMPAELLVVIENSGGRLEVSDGRLRAVYVLPNFHAAVMEHADALITLLQERAKPRPSGFLIPPAELAAAQRRYEQAQAAKAAPLPPVPPPPAPASAPGFTYKPRTQEQWQKRIDQSWQSNRTFRPKPEPVTPIIEDREIEDGDSDDDSGESPKAKVSSTTPCVCGHPRKDHHTTPESHDTVDGHAFYCVTAHCAVFSYRDGISAPCDCQYFRVAETDALKFTKPRVGPYDLCAGCGHFKISHCTKAKPGKVNRLKPGELAYRILQADGMSYGCRHFDLANPSCQCDSTGCSATPDGKNFCDCEKFVNPWLRPNKRVAAKPRKKRTQKSAFVTGAPELFPPGEASTNP